uniref:PDZ domain-containing protein n=1 Tax=Bursaphelenchus xylophilus TaxID=6326 RepID=A0A1I7SMJ8_BURXY
MGFPEFSQIFSYPGGSNEKNSVPITISKVLPNLPAAQTGQVFVGDTIIEINGINVENKTHEEVVQILRDAPGPHITLSLKHNEQLAPLLRSPSKRLSVGPGDSMVDVNMYKIQSALKSANDRSQNNLKEGEDQAGWKNIQRLPLPMAIVSRYLWGTDKLRNNAFELRTVDGKSSGIIHCEDRKALQQWIKNIENHIETLNKKSVKMSNKYLHPSEHITYIGWIEERMEAGYFDDPKLKWAQRFLILKGTDLCVFETPPLNSEELDKCVCLYKIYETALKTAIKHVDRRENVFILESHNGTQHYLSLHSPRQLQQLESGFYNSLYKSVTAMQTRTFSCSYEGRPAGFVLDIKQGLSLYDIPTKKYIWQYGFEALQSSSDDGKMNLQLILTSPEPGVTVDIKDIISDEVLCIVYTMHSFYVTKVMGVDPEFLKATPLN